MTLHALTASALLILVLDALLHRTHRLRQPLRLLRRPMTHRERALSLLFLAVTCGAACEKPAQYDPTTLDGSTSDTADRPVVLDFGSEAGAATNDSATNDDGRTDVAPPSPADGPSDLPSEVAPTTDTAGEAAVVTPPAVTWELISAGM